jgi:hypothetical protein
MKTDGYTKTILTVIAASLLWLCVENTNRPKVVSAQGPVKVIIASVDSGAIVPVRIWGGTKYAHTEVGEDNPLPVSVVSK